MLHENGGQADDDGGKDHAIAIPIATSSQDDDLRTSLNSNNNDSNDNNDSYDTTTANVNALDQHQDLEQRPQVQQSQPQELQAPAPAPAPALPNHNQHNQNNNGNDSDSDSDIEIVQVTPASHPQPQQQPQHQPQQHHHQNQQHQPQQHHQINHHNHNHQQQQQQHYQQYQQPPFDPSKIYDIPFPEGHEPTWEHVWPVIQRTTPAPMTRHTNQTRAYRLSLLSNTEFTITAVAHHTNSFDFTPNLFGLRKPIKEITRTHASPNEKAIMEEGRWRIPLSIYQVFLSYLNHESNTVVYPIPSDQIKIASLGKAAAERGYPTPEELMDNGVPDGLAAALAPYQRGGVDFVMQRNGRALIADEMGLGKTVQGIAAMTCFENEWPLLVLSPSTARYHWEAEFLHWLGEDSEVNRKKDEDAEEEDLANVDGFTMFDTEEEEKKASDAVDVDIDVDVELEGLGHTKRKADTDDSNQSNAIPMHKKSKLRDAMRLLKPSEINVLTTSSDPILAPGVRVVVVSYGLIPNLIKKGALYPGQFKCIIVDESHMLKNKKSKRTLSVMPLLKGATRVVMLSGTPALSKAQELFPQLNALGAHKGWWDDEEAFHKQYVKDKYSDPSFAELHTLLTSTVMIRRLKNDILKDMPKKCRENVFVNVRCPDLKNQITEGLFLLRDGKGVLGKLSVLHQKDLKMSEPSQQSQLQHANDNSVSAANDIGDPNVTNANGPPTTSGHAEGGGGDEGKSRKAALNKVFQLTGKAKIPILIDMLKRWIDDPTNGKICVFAHHIAVLDALVDGGNLSNAHGSNSKYIRIDGSTNPRVRQDQIISFQNDPTVRIAILGITAAGVGVTLTAASTIWFAELFWTPALLVQAEDRCHRIGQQARVKCLYTIAKGTLDEVLWILLKRKFQALGEFVEGKEMMDIVVHNSYSNEFDAVDRKCDLGKDDDDNSLDEADAAALANEGSIQHDIEELAKEDIAGAGNTSDDDCEGNEDPSSTKQNKKSTAAAASSENIICLSDDDDDDNTNKKQVAEQTLVPVDICIEEVLERYRSTRQSLTLPKTMKMKGMKTFYMLFSGQRYNLNFAPFFGRIIISTKQNETDFPGFGSVLVAVNNFILPLGTALQHCANLLKQELAAPPVRLMFGKDQTLSKVVQVWSEEYRKKSKARHQRESSVPTQEPRIQQQPPTSETGGGHPKPIAKNNEATAVIELLDD